MAEAIVARWLSLESVSKVYKILSLTVCEETPSGEAISAAVERACGCDHERWKRC